MSTALHLALLVPVAIALLSSWLTYGQGWAYFSKEEAQPQADVGAASIIVPLRGWPEGTEGLLDRLLSTGGSRLR